MSFYSFYLRDDLRQALGPSASLRGLMTLDGESYRIAPGRRTLRVELGGRGYFIKQHTGVGWAEIAKNLLYGRAPVVDASCEWRAVHRLDRLGVPTLRIAGYGRAGCNPARRRSFVVSDELSGSVDLETWSRTAQQRDDWWQLRRLMLREIARVARLLHDNGVNHRDFYLCHFHLMPPLDPASGPAAPPPELRLIDLHRVQLRARPTPRRWRVKDIGGLLYSAQEFGLERGDRLRFARLYSGRPLRETLRSDAAFWRAVQRRAQRLQAKASRQPPAGMPQ